MTYDLHDKASFIPYANVQEALALARTMIPAGALPFAETVLDPTLRAAAGEATFAAHPLITEVEGTEQDEIAHFVFQNDPINVGTFWHEIGHAVEWEALELRYPDEKIWNATDPEWNAPDNSVMTDFWKARGLPGTFAQTLQSHWNGLGYEMFAESFKRLMCGAPEGTDDAGIPWPGDDAMRAFFWGLFPAPAPQPAPTPPPAPQPTPTPVVTPPPPAVGIPGVDISNWQGPTVDFDALAKAVQFVVIKATEGLSFQDPTFARNWSEAKRVGLARGAYHFAHPELNGPEDEADYFLNMAALDSGDFAWLDWETNVPAGFAIAEWCRRFCQRVKDRTGASPVIYLNQSQVKKYDWSAFIAAGFGLALAAYTEPIAAVPWPVIAFRQTTSSGALPGIPGAVDLDIFYGTREQLAKYGAQGGDDMFTDADRAMLARVKELLEAREPMVWTAREQRGLDVETGKPLDQSIAPIDPRIRAK